MPSRISTCSCNPPCWGLTLESSRPLGNTICCVRPTAVRRPTCGDVLDIISVRETLTQAAVDFETARRASRLSLFRLQLAEGMSLGAIARAWGFSRLLVSRMLKEDQPDLTPNES